MDPGERAREVWVAESREIPRERWADYLSGLSAREREHVVRVALAGRSLAEQTVVGDAPLRGIAVADVGDVHGLIEIRLGGGVTHWIPEPRHMWALEDEDGAVACLDIEDRARVKTLIFFPAA
jgi:hypothetical protein